MKNWSVIEWVWFVGGSIVATLYRLQVVRDAWRWFVVPKFHVSELSLGGAFVAITIAMLMTDRHSGASKDSQASLSTPIVSLLSVGAFHLLLWCMS